MSTSITTMWTIGLLVIIFILCSMYKMQNMFLQYLSSIFGMYGTEFKRKDQLEDIKQKLSHIVENLEKNWEHLSSIDYNIDKIDHIKNELGIIGQLLKDNNDSLNTIQFNTNDCDKMLDRLEAIKENLSYNHRFSGDE